MIGRLVLAVVGVLSLLHAVVWIILALSFVAALPLAGVLYVLAVAACLGVGGVYLLRGVRRR